MTKTDYDVIIIGAGPGGIFSAYEMATKNPNIKIGVFEAGFELSKRKCPIDGDKVKSCIKCKTCAIMSASSIQQQALNLKNFACKISLIF